MRRAMAWIVDARLSASCLVSDMAAPARAEGGAGARGQRRQGQPNSHRAGTVNFLNLSERLLNN